MKKILPLIISWYEKNKKELPWRMSNDPYAIWISEIMLQQTRIEAVIPYYHRFLHELPDIDALASVEDDRLMKLWEGLGYYSRARNLKKAAEVIVMNYDGRLPETAAELKKLPGIGDYTAGAISSIAFGQPEPAVDGNVLRVVSRITASKEDISLPRTKRTVSEMLREIYPTGTSAGMVTEGLMELGETVCLPNGAPLCERCPVKDHCKAFLSAMVEQYPVKTEKKSRKTEKKTVFLLHNTTENTYGIRKRPKEGLLADLWEFPNATGHLTESEAASEIGTMGFIVKSIRSIGSARHIFTHVEWDMIGYEIEIEGTSPDVVFETSVKIEGDFAIPTAFRYYSDLMIK